MGVFNYIDNCRGQVKEGLLTLENGINSVSGHVSTTQLTNRKTQNNYSNDCIS